MLNHDEILRLYGPWKTHEPVDAAQLLSDYPGQWWIAGGWVIEAFTGVSRPHEDLDIVIPRTELPLLLAFLRNRLDVWAATRSLTPITEASPDLPEECDNLWLRASGADPWEYDVLLEDTDSLTWVCKRDLGIRRPFADVLWRHEGITFLRPEVQLLLKAKHARAKDLQDLENCLRIMDSESLSWLADALRQAHPGHPWLGILGVESAEEEDG